MGVDKLQVHVAPEMSSLHIRQPTRGEFRPPFNVETNASDFGAGIAEKEKLRTRSIRFRKEGRLGTQTPTSYLTSNDDSNSSTKVLLEVLGTPGVA